jgi:putative ABC transport system ATP-binding protein
MRLGRSLALPATQIHPSISSSDRIDSGLPSSDSCVRRLGKVHPMNEQQTPTDVICTANLSKTFVHEGVEVSAFRDVSLAIARNQLVAIMGPSGSGKSTLLHILGGIEPPTAGEIWIDGQNLAGLNDLELTLLRRRRIGFVFQSFNLVPTLSVMENVTLPLILDGISAREAEPRAQECLTRVGMSHRLRHLPSQLSGGEQQRVAIARALVIQPSLILADEPTGNLDSARGRGITQLLADVAHQGQQTVVVVTHDMRVAAKSDRLIVLLDGQIRFDGDPSHVAEWMAAMELEISG